MTLTEKIKQHSEKLGFFSCGISQVRFLEKEAKDLEQWLRENRNGEMKYMEQHFDKRVNPLLLVENAKSVISVLLNYLPEEKYKQPENSPKISKYAWGEDYHHVLKRKMGALLEWIEQEVGASIQARIFTDSAPVMDKVWAAKSGLGWIGKHTNLIVPKAGSFFFIGEIICDLNLTYDQPIADFCGTCTRCIDACPTEALTPYKIDAQKCISYLTIELKKEMPATFNDKLDGWSYGCDICQDVCPWNRHAKAHTGEEFRPLDFILTYTRENWENLDKATFKKMTRHSAMSRIKWEKLQDNVQSSLGNAPNGD